MKVKIVAILLILFPLLGFSQIKNTVDSVKEGGAFITINPSNPHFNWSLKYIADAFKKLNCELATLNNDDYENIINTLSKCDFYLYANTYVQFLIAHCYYEKQSYDTAIIYYTTCINTLRSLDEFDMDSSYVQTGTGNNYIETFHSWIICYSPYEAYLERSYCKFYLENYRGAISDENTALSVFKNNKQFGMHTSDCYANIAASYYNLKLFQYAKNYCDLSIAKDNSQSLAYYIRGLSNIKLGLKETGCQDLDKAGELGEMKAYDAIKDNCN